MVVQVQRLGRSCNLPKIQGRGETVKIPVIRFHTCRSLGLSSCGRRSPGLRICGTICFDMRPEPRLNHVGYPLYSFCSFCPRFIFGPHWSSLRFARCLTRLVRLFLEMHVELEVLPNKLGNKGTLCRASCILENPGTLRVKYYCRVCSNAAGQSKYTELCF